MSRTSSDVKNRCNVNQTCLNCGGDLGRNKYYCSQKCRAEYIRNHKKCVICGKYFYASPSSEKKTCSKACEKIERATIGKIGKSAQNLINAQKAAALSPNSGRFETNAIAKSWVVQSPDGTIYNINNLSLWASEHADMLPGTPTQFSYGIRSIKRTIQFRNQYVTCIAIFCYTFPCRISAPHCIWTSRRITKGYMKIQIIPRIWVMINAPLIGEKIPSPITQRRALILL